MKAIRIHEFGASENLRVDEIEKSTPGADEVLIKTAAAGINYADTMLRQDKYLFTPELPFTLGFEVAGTIEAVGANVSAFKVGQRVLATVPATSKPSVNGNSGVNKYLPCRSIVSA